MKKLYFLVISLSFIFLQLVIANEGEVCFVSSIPMEGSGNETYDVFLNNAVRISSLDAGFRNTGCATAVFGAAGSRNEILGTNGNRLQNRDIINHCANFVRLTGERAGTFDQNLNGLISLLNRDPVNCYEIVVKRINNFADPPVKVLPPSQNREYGNVLVKTYRPYNFGVNDIIEAMRKVSPIRGGMGIGGVVYVNNVPTDAHMFQPIAINSVAELDSSGQKFHNFKIYDPFFGADIPVSIMFDQTGRIYSNLWQRGGSPLWFHLEELFYVTNVGRCSYYGVPIPKNPVKEDRMFNNIGYSFRIAPGDLFTTYYTPSPIRRNPTSCGPKLLNICSRESNCLPDEYCNSNLNCLCKQKICGDNIVDIGEQCDDGNVLNDDGCSSVCKKEICGDGIKQTNEQCDVGSGSQQDPLQCPSYPNLCVGCNCLILPEPPTSK